MIILIEGRFEVVFNTIYESGRPLVGDFCRVKR